MCGIGGIVGSSTSEAVGWEALKLIERSLYHRGPDDGACWQSPSGRAGLVHRRLSILDLSPLGHQPMHTRDGRFSIVFNGEIYNFRELRKELISDGVSLKSQGDTEVLLELFARRGADCVNLLSGMFAFAIWDEQERELFLARDALGIKPLYVWQHGDRLAFASELKALLSSAIGPRKIDGSALAGYLLMGSVQEPRTLLKDVFMLPAGSILEWKGGRSVQRKYWKLDFGNFTCDEKIGSSKTNISSYESAISHARVGLRESIERHFVSDVPVGIFLSGGIDSTAVLAIAKQIGCEQIQTFSIGFDEKEFDEGELARRTARHFGTQHHEWRMTSKEGEGLFEKFLEAMDQPSNDGFNTFCVSKFAHDRGLKVVLSGLGGDELFGGYPSFQAVPKLTRWHQRLQLLGPMRFGMSSAVRSLWPTGPRARFAEFLASSGSAIDAYRAMRGCFTSYESKKLVAHITGESFKSLRDFEMDWEQDEAFATWAPGDQVSYLELTRYMRNQLLRDSDVMSMAWGLELRVPFVDRSLAECVGQIPTEFRLSAKRLLVEAVGDIPPWVLEQPKRGFRFPFQQWLAAIGPWTQRFHEILSASPVKPKTWYQQWMLVVLEHALGRIR